MSTPADFLINQQLNQYVSSLRSWSSRILAESKFETIIQLSQNTPPQGYLIRSIRHPVARQEKQRAEASIERHLLHLCTRMTPQERQDLITSRRTFQSLQRCWPRVAEKIRRS